MLGLLYYYRQRPLTQYSAIPSLLISSKVGSRHLFLIDIVNLYRSNYYEIVVGIVGIVGIVSILYIVREVSTASTIRQLGRLGDLSDIGDLGNIGNLDDIGDLGDISNIGDLGDTSDIGNIGNIGDLIIYYSQYLLAIIKNYLLQLASTSSY